MFAFFITFWRQLHKRYQFVNDQVADEDDPSPFADLDSSFLVANRTGIYYVSSNISVMAFKKYYAIGSGASYALVLPRSPRVSRAAPIPSPEIFSSSPTAMVACSPA